MTTAPLRDFVARPDEDPLPVHRVHAATRDALEAAKGTWNTRGELLMSVTTRRYWAWMRAPLPYTAGALRIMGRPADSAEGAAQALLAKLTGTR